MKRNIATTITEAAKAYNHKGFIFSDPVQFPHRYANKKDVEISAFLTSLISFGQRSQIIKTAELLDKMFEGHPYDFIRSRKWEQDKIPGTITFYRTIRLSDFYEVCNVLADIYSVYGSLEDLVVENAKKLDISIVEALELPFHGINGVPDPAKGSTCKRLCLFLRWIVRNDGIVDLGLWKKISPASLIIPLDTHTATVAREIGILSRKTPDMKAAKEITDNLSTIFPYDPTLGDFALFGIGEDTDGILLQQWESQSEPASTFATANKPAKEVTKGELRKIVAKATAEQFEEFKKIEAEQIKKKVDAVNEVVSNNRALMVATTYNILFSAKIASIAVYQIPAYLEEAGLLRMDVKKQTKDLVRATQNYEKACYSVFGENAKFLEDSVSRIMKEIGLDVEKLFWSIKSFLDKLKIGNASAFARLEQARTLLALSVEIFNTRMCRIRALSPDLPTLNYLCMDKILRFADKLSNTLCGNLGQTVDLNDDNNCRLAVSVIDTKLSNEDRIARAIMLEGQL